MMQNIFNTSQENLSSIFSKTITFNEFIKIAYLSLKSLNFNSININMLNTYNSFSDNQKFNLQHSEISLYVEMIKFFEKNTFSQHLMLFLQFDFEKYKTNPLHTNMLTNQHMSSQYEYFKLFLDYCYSTKSNINDFKDNPAIKYFYFKLKPFEKKKISEYSYIIPEIINFQNEFHKK